MTTISPSRTRRRLTMPSIGETMDVFESMSSALSRCARACATRRDRPIRRLAGAIDRGPRRRRPGRARHRPPRARCRARPPASAPARSARACARTAARRRGRALRRRRGPTWRRAPARRRRVRRLRARGPAADGARRVALRLHGIDAREHLAGLDAVAFGDRQADDLAHHARTDVGVPRRDDLAGGGDGRSESAPAA